MGRAGGGIALFVVEVGELKAMLYAYRLPGKLLRPGPYWVRIVGVRSSVYFNQLATCTLVKRYTGST